MSGNSPSQKQISAGYKGRLDYPSKPHYLRTVRGICFLVAAVGSIACALTYSYWGKDDAFNTGPLSENHARFVNDCRVCHTDADTDMLKALLNGAKGAGLPEILSDKVAISPGESKKRLLKKIFSTTGLSAMDRACLQCHPASALHMPQTPELALRAFSPELAVVHATNCAECHREHVSHNRMAPPDRVRCSDCHNDAFNLKTSLSVVSNPEGKASTIPENRDLGDGIIRFIAPYIPPGSLEPFASFEHGHPGFRYELPGAYDPADIKFNHARHFRSDIPKLDGKDLNCASCHQLEPGGAFYQPISYEKHCAECHSLQISSNLPNLKVPHGDSEKVRFFLGSLKISLEYQFRESGITDPVDLASHVDAEMQAMYKRGSPDLNEMETRVFFEGDPANGTDGRAMRSGERKFLTECAMCHTVLPGNESHAPHVNPPEMASRWLQRGRFTHLPHQHMLCAGCHSQATLSEKTSDILLPSQTLCVECHREPTTHLGEWATMKAPSSSDSSVEQILAKTQRKDGGVKWDCQNCHVFHAPPNAAEVLLHHPTPVGAPLQKAETTGIIPSPVQASAVPSSSQ